MQQRRVFGKFIHRYEVLDSTNLEAWRLCRQNRGAEGTMVLAQYQTHGRGQANTHWESEAGKNLCVSAILEPLFLPPDRQFQLNKVISLAVRDAVRQMLPGHQVPIKWPNDIYVGTKKIAGILIENAIMGDRLSQSIAGIGININQRNFDPSLPNPVSIARITGRDAHPGICLDYLCAALDKWYGLLKSSREAELDRHYLDALLGLGERRRFLAGGEEILASIFGVDRHGKLVLHFDHGQEKAFDMKEISFIIGE